MRIKPLIILIFLMSSGSFAENALKVSVEKNIKLAVPFKIIFQDAQGKEIISVSTSSFKNSEFEILKIVKKSPSSIELEIMPFSIGISTFPPLEFSDSSGKRSTPEIPIKIEPRFEKTDGKIKDIYPPLFFLNLKKMLLIFLILIAAWLAAKKLLRKKETNNSYVAQAIQDYRTPYEKALQEIQELEKKAEENFSPKEFYDSLSNIFRVYLAQRYYIDAPKMTTAESIKAFKNQINDYSLLASLRETLDIADLAKFAKFADSKSSALENSDKSKKLISRLEEIKLDKENKSAGENK